MASGLKYFVILPLLSAVQAVQPSAPSPVPAPLRELKWGQLNFLHTTDTHGWLAGHLSEPSYSADWGDYVSFATRMREIAEADGRDLLLIDTGDRVEGNGLYDSSDPKGVYTSEIIRHQPIDVLSPGNHELYKKTTAEAELQTTVPNFHGHYLASNIDIYEPETGELIALGPRSRKFTTKNQGVRVVAFGFLFDFTMNSNNTIVQPVEETVEETWFQQVLKDQEVDLFLVIGHVPLRSKEYSAVFNAIRANHPDTPIQFFGGHLHIRDCHWYDPKAVGLASGRFMETIGFVSLDGLSTERNQSRPESVTFERMYIDNNLFSFHHHTRLVEAAFPTESGRNVSRLIQESRSALKLDEIYGCIPKTLWMSRTPYTATDSIYAWLQQAVLPDMLGHESRRGKPAFAILNTGAIRFDLFEGQFTRDSAYMVSPFTSGFRYLKDVGYAQALQVLDLLNEQPRILATPEAATGFLPWTLAPPEQSARDYGVDPTKNREDSIFDISADQSPMSSQLGTRYDIIPGYTTTDDLGTDGDDTIHSTIAFYDVPNCIGALAPNGGFATLETVDLVYIDFIEPYVALAASQLGLGIDVPHESDIYMPSTSLTDVLVAWITANWGCSM
ncbi:hypothetical protein BDW74DRAFT_33426 [Aspergillus multicolor]|uniref:metallophosphoesterase family protein n=1 Tax=Aspergillus multicolor TaxID=41759 RepID=UPI003CCD1968